jgi:hypothetical protein
MPDALLERATELQRLGARPAADLVARRLRELGVRSRREASLWWRQGSFLAGSRMVIV